jgi:hypothetical protein
LFDFFMAQSSQRKEPPQKPGRFSATLGVKKVLSKVRVGKPLSGGFFRVRKDSGWSIQVFIVEIKLESEFYVAAGAAASVLSDFVRPAQLHTAVDRQGNPFLIPVILPGEDGRWNSWHESLAHAMGHAEDNWVRLKSNKGAGAYDVFEALANLPGPTWPENTFDELFQIAFRGKIIADETHPIVDSLLGKV